LILLACGVSANVVRFPFPLLTPDAVFNEGLKIREGMIREV
jgi:4-aminobutyrate aminotransferase